MICNRKVLLLAAVCCLLPACSFHRKKYENPISKDTQQPDKVLFDKAVNDIERGRYEVARLTLQALINTYDTSEYMAKAKLAIADSWFREGGSHGMAQAEAEYKDFQLFYPTMEEAPESQEKICMIHYKQMEKADRDTTQALRAEEECKQLLEKYPNSKFAPQVQQRLRDIQEAIADAEFRVGTYYHNKGSNPAAANRLGQVVDQYPLYSRSDQALWQMGDSFSKMGPRFRQKTGEAFARILKDYPLSPLADGAKKKLNEMELPVPEADPVAYAHMKYELENHKKAPMISHATGLLKHGPDVRNSARSGTPAMTSLRPSIPVSVPTPAAPKTGTNEVSVSVGGDSSALANNPDARQTPPAAAGTATAVPAGQKPAAAPSAGSQPVSAKDQVKNQKKKKKGKPAPEQPAAAPAAADPKTESDKPPAQ